MMLKHIIAALFRGAFSVINKIRLKHGWYSKSILPDYDFDFLQSKWPYVNPECVRNDFKRGKATGIDLSICIPMYNVEAYIEDLMKAIDSQESEFSFEVILVDDGSTDTTAEIVNSFITGKNKYTMIRQENAGISAARNTAINHASGEYICFVDGDDLIADNSIQSLVSAAKENDADIVKGKYGLKRGSKITEKGYASGYIWGGIFRASLFEHVRFPIGFWYEDMINLFLVVPQSRKTITLDKVTIYHNDVEGSASKQQSRAKSYKSLEDLYLVLSLTKDYKTLGLQDRAYLDNRLIVECSRLMASRTEELDEVTRQQVFLACNNLFTEEHVDPSQFSGIERIFADAILNKDFVAWKLAAKI